MTNIANLLTEHMAIWTAADTEKKSGRGRSNGNAGSVYGVKKQRELILELAVRGKLVPQDPNDEPASELLKRIQAEKAKLIAEGKLKKEKPLAPIGDDEKPFELPKGWEWQRLPETYYSISPRGNQLKGSEIKEVGTFPVVDQGQQFISGYTDIADLLIEIPHPIIVFGDHTTNIKLIDFDFVAGADGTKLLAPILIYPRFYYHYLSSYKLENRGYARHFKVLNDNLIALPPIAEQDRIVAKVDELMALCDQLEQQHSNAQEAHETLVSQLLATLTQSQNAAEFNANWQRIYAHFDALFTTEASIDALKQTLLQLAVMGKLVPQDPNDEPSSELLKRIQAEKAKLIAEGKLKKEKPLAPIGEDEKPFELPKGWAWVRLKTIATKITDGTHYTPKYVGNGVPFLSVKDMSSGKLDFSSTRFISELEHGDLFKRCNPEFGDLLLTKVGTTGIPVIVDTKQPFSIFVSVALIKALWDFINVQYLKLLISSPIVKKQSAEGTEGIGNKNLVLRKIEEFVLVLPPLAEQHRIVAKVDALMVLCDQLKTRIKQANLQQQAIADALVAQAVNQ
ncbi:restriction endonuclease subunit S [Methylotenera sp.]|uniref:restriction endonuclease subunit S n=1 Tax=Methylotenera sp. TaxID=2051956 RepID=UPI002733082C|nr:restriction endonuclease subunit S [Methylotenera sp.]MDP3777951.1 restriction endonuclease subunit S [Methylotenera sp.]